MKKEFLMLSDLAGRWQCSKEYLHELIRQGSLTPSVLLEDDQRYVGGEFVGGMWVGDVHGAVSHKSYSEFYVNSDPETPDSRENWHQCARVAFCHCPEIESDGRYSFQFVSEVLWPGPRDKWFYLDRNRRIKSDDAARFRFEWQEIERFESNDGESGVDAPTDVPRPDASGGGTQKRTNTKKEGRVHILAAEIDLALSNAINPNDYHSVWAELLKMAEDHKGYLRGVGDDEIKYWSDGGIQFLSKKTLMDRLRKRKSRKNLDLP